MPFLKFLVFQEDGFWRGVVIPQDGSVQYHVHSEFSEDDAYEACAEFVLRRGHYNITGRLPA